MSEELMKMLQSANCEEVREILFRLMGYVGSRAKNDSAGDAQALAKSLLEYAEEIRQEQLDHVDR